MRMMTRNQERLLSRLIRLAGSSTTLERALARVDAEKRGEQTLDDVIVECLRLRKESEEKR